MKKRRGMNIKNSKDRGAWAELCFAVRAVEEGLPGALSFAFFAKGGIPQLRPAGEFTRRLPLPGGSVRTPWDG